MWNSWISGVENKFLLNEMSNKIAHRGHGDKSEYYDNNINIVFIKLFNFTLNIIGLFFFHFNIYSKK